MPEHDKIATFLGFDFGLKRIGVAVGQSLTMSASEVTVLKANAGVPNWVEVEKLIRDWQPAGIVIGLPFHIDGSEAPITEETRKFIRRVQGRFPTPVFVTDERLSTREAKSQLDALGPRSKGRTNKIDSLAAKVILEQWLRSQA